MDRSVRIVSIKRKEVDDEKLALAFLLLAKALREKAEKGDAPELTAEAEAA